MIGIYILTWQQSLKLQSQVSLYLMDIDLILPIIPRMIHKWNQKDVQVWLTFIELPQLIPKFKYLRIDGNRLLMMSPQYLSATQIIQSNIIKKKILNWVQYLVQAQPYCHQQLNKKQIQSATQLSKKTRILDYSLSNAVKWDTDDQSITDSQQTTMTKQLVSKDSSPARYSYIPNHQNLHIYERCNNQMKFFICDQTSITFGMNPQNSFFIVENDIEPNHCTIIHRQNSHYIISSLRNSGVWIKISKKIKLEEKCIIEMGQIDFHILVDKHLLTINILSNGCQSQQFIFNGYEKEWVKVGRRNTCDIIKPKDTTLSGYHGKFTFDEDYHWNFEDLETTNGSWLRCMDETLVTDKMTFRIGKSSYMYQSRIWINEECRSVSSTESQYGTCRGCRNRQKNCYFRPCYHNQYCYQCASLMKTCPICKAKIKKLQKIFKL